MEALGLGEKVLEHFRNPRNVGTIDNADGYSMVENPICGDLTEMFVKISEEKIEDIKFRTLGCFATIASASALTEAIKNRSLMELLNFEKEEKEVVERLLAMIREELGNLPERKWHCPPASIEAFLKAIRHFYLARSDSQMVRRLDGLLNTVKTYYSSISF